MIISPTKKSFLTGLTFGTLAGFVGGKLLYVPKKIGLVPLTLALVFGYEISTNIGENYINHVDNVDKRSRSIDSLRIQTDFQKDTMRIHRGVYFQPDALQSKPGVDSFVQKKDLGTQGMGSLEDIASQPTQNAQPYANRRDINLNNMNLNDVNTANSASGYSTTQNTNVPPIKNSFLTIKNYELSLDKSAHTAEFFEVHDDDTKSLIVSSPVIFARNGGPDNGLFTLYDIGVGEGSLSPGILRFNYSNKNQVGSGEGNIMQDRTAGMKEFTADILNANDVCKNGFRVLDEVLEKISEIYNKNARPNGRAIYVKIQE